MKRQLTRRDFVKTGLFPRELSRALHLAFDRRQRYDYGEMIAITFTFATTAALVRHGTLRPAGTADDVHLPGQVRRRAVDEKAGARLIGRSHRMEQVRHTVEQVAATLMTALITGESGTGKELVARAIHLRSPRRHAMRCRSSNSGCPVYATNARKWSDASAA